jgi:TPR repeat protein
MPLTDPERPISKRALAALLAVFIGSVAVSVGTILFLRSLGLDAYIHKDFRSAGRYLMAPALFGDAQAQTFLGQMYAMGSGRDQDGGKAIYWLERAANNGIVEAETMVGTLYLTGVGTAVDLEKARFWLEKAAAAKDDEAKRMLKTMRVGRNHV